MNKALYIGIGVLAGIVFGNQIKRLPLVSKIPTI